MAAIPIAYALIGLLALAAAVIATKPRNNNSSGRSSSSNDVFGGLGDIFSSEPPSGTLCCGKESGKLETPIHSPDTRPYINPIYDEELDAYINPMQPDEDLDKYTYIRPGVYYDPERGRYVTPIHQQEASDLVYNKEEGVKNTKPLSPRARHGENGRLESVFTKVEKQHIGTGTPTTDAAREHVRVLGKQTDDAGHAIGKNLGGKGGKTSGNIFPQSPSVNRGAFSQFEKQVAKEVKAGKEVFTKVTPKYKPGATRPHEIVYQVRVNGKTTTRTFPNP